MASSSQQKSRAPNTRHKTSPKKNKTSTRTPTRASGFVTGTQPKLAIGKKNDPYEREADRVADYVTQGGDGTTPSITPIGKGGLIETQGGAQKSPLQRQSDEDEESIQTLPIQRQDDKEEVPVQTMTVQRQADEEVEEPIQTTAIQRQADEEEETIQPTAIQRQADEEEEPIQTMAIQRQVDDQEEEIVQQNRTGIDASETPLMTGVASRAINNKDSGSPMNPATRNTLESRMGMDFSDVRVHDDAKAHEAARDINARAFTHKNDIWLGRGESQGNVGLMAHEATHVAQQTGSAQRQIVQRVPGDDNGNEQADTTSTPVDATTLPLETGRLEPATETIRFSQIEIPSFKTAAHRGTLYADQSPLKRKKNYTRGTTGQRDTWKNQLSTDTIQSGLEDKIKAANHSQTVDRAQTYVFEAPSKFGRNPPRNFIGDLATISKELTLPTWGGPGRGEPKSFHVDHIVELQLANWNDNAWANTLANMELLEAEANMASGSQIRNSIIAKADEFVETTNGQYGQNAAEIKQNYTLKFDQAIGRGGSRIQNKDYWTKDQIEAGNHLQAVNIGSLSELGSADMLRVFPSATGGVGKRFRWRDAEGPVEPHSEERDWLAPFKIQQKQFITNGENIENSETLGTLWIYIPDDDPDWKPQPVEAVSISRFPGAQFAGYINKNQIRSKARRLEHKKTSPVQINEFDILPDEGILITGQILPDVPLIAGIGIEFEVRGGELALYKEFSTGDFTVPGPVEVTDSSLIISVGTRRSLAIEGQVNFAVENVGEGFLGAGASTGEGFNLEGGFDFDSELFDPARIRMKYENEVFSGDGELGIKRGTIRGIQSASINVNVQGESWQATGTVTPERNPVISQGTLTARHDPETGFEITGVLELSNDNPILRGGTLEATVSSREDGEGYKLSARGDIPLSIAGVDINIQGEYDDGAFSAQAIVPIEKGRLSGSVTAGVTNMAVGDDGQPSGEPTNTITVFGEGQATIQITPWLEGTAGIKLLPNGEIEIVGRIGIPDTLELFPERRYDRNIFTLGFDIPILGFAVAGQRVGIFLNISGGLDLTAGFGPGELREMEIGIEYNPDHEDDTRVTGRGVFAIPADAGLRLFVRAALGVGIPIVSAQAGLEIGGMLGLQGEARAEANVEWTPSQGLVLEAEGSIFVEPKFTFDITGFVLVEADLLITTIELYSKRWQLAAFEYGSGMRLGVVFPVEYREGHPFDISLDDVEFVYPDIDAESILSGLFDEIV